jgi:Mrp family chromosome partitioning ATPase
MTVSTETTQSDRLAPESAANSQLQMLRSHVEAELKNPAVIMVTSAHHGDGKSLTAHSLANSFVRSGHRVALVAAESTRTDGGLVLLDLPHDGDDVAWRERLGAFVQKLRDDYDFAVIDPGTFLGSDAAMALGRLVDGILVAVRMGRAPSDEDELMIRAIDHCSGRIIGVVATDQEAIAEYGRSSAQPDNANRPPARRPVERAPYALPAKSLAH